MAKFVREGSSALLIGLDGRFLLQERDNLPHVSDPGMLSLFGGRREGNESFLECVVREVYEEIGHYLPPERFGLLGRYCGPDPSTPNGTLHGEVFIAIDVPVDGLVVTEGRLRTIAADELRPVCEQLSPSAWYALKLFFDDSLFERRNQFLHMTVDHCQRD